MERRGKGRFRGQPEALCRLFFLAFFFLCGTLLGQALALCLPPDVWEELRVYLSDYVCLPDVAERSVICLFSTLLLYLRYPLAAAFLGFTSAGAFLLPALTVLFAAFFSFSIACFTGAFSGVGVVLSFAVMGLRAMVALPCYFVLALSAWERSSMLSMYRRREHTNWSPGSFWKRIGSVTAILLLSACIDFWLTPWLLRAVLPQVLLG